MQRAAWLAMACDEVGAVSVTFSHEHGRKLEEEAPPETLDGQWTHVIAHIVRPFACPRWHVRHTNEGLTIETPEGTRSADNDERDAFMIAESKRNGLVLVTSGDPAFKRAKKAGAQAYRPEAYAASVIPFQLARSRFMKRLYEGFRAFEMRFRTDPHLSDNLNVIWNCYEGIWDDELRR